MHNADIFTKFSSIFEKCMSSSGNFIVSANSKVKPKFCVVESKDYLLNCDIFYVGVEYVSISKIFQ